MAVSTSYGAQGTENGVLVTPRAFKRDGTKTGIVWCHGHGGSGLDGMDQTTIGPITYALANEGNPVASCDMGGITTWGSDTATGKMANAIAQLSAAGANTSKVILGGGSMGALTALGSILKGTPAAAAVAAVFLVVGVPDLATFHDANRGGWATEIETAFGGAAAYNAAVASHDPAQSPSSFAGIPIRFWQGSADTTAPVADAQSFATAAGSRASVVTVPGGTHTTTAGLIPPADVVAFLKPYL